MVQKNEGKKWEDLEREKKGNVNTAKEYFQKMLIEVISVALFLLVSLMFLVVFCWKWEHLGNKFFMGNTFFLQKNKPALLLQNIYAQQILFFFLSPGSYMVQLSPYYNFTLQRGFTSLKDHISYGIMSCSA